MMSFVSTLRKHRRNIVSLIVLFFSANLLGTTLDTATTPVVQTNIYEEIAHLYLPSLAKQEFQEQQESAEVLKDNARVLEEESQKYFSSPNLKDVKVQSLGDAEKLRLLYQVFVKSKPTPNRSNILNTNVFADLEVFCGYKPTLEHHLFSLLDHTQTAVGKIELQKMIYNPTNNISELKNKQELVQTLLDNENLFNALDEQLKRMKKVENDYTWIWKDLENEVEKYFDQVYLGKKFFIDFSGFNKSEIALEALTLWKTIISPSLAITSPLLLWGAGSTIKYHTFLFILQANLQELKNMLEGAVDGWHKNSINQRISFITQQIEALKNSPSFVQKVKDLAKWPFKEQNRKIISNIISETFTTDHLIPKAIVGTGIALIAGIYLWSVSRAISSARMFNNVSNDIQTRMISVATFTNTMNDISRLLQSNDVFTQNANAFIINDILKTFSLEHDNEHDKATADLLDTLQANTFKGEAGFFSHKGRALASFKKIHDVKDNFADAMSAVGQLDAYLSIAKLYKKFANHENAKFCFVDFVENKTPYINISNGWHPILNPNTVVTNNIELGQPGKARNVILTGPNAGGKSTNLKTITIAIILAQAFGIAPAQSMTITPFALINTYLNIADTEGQESLFQAEMNRAQELLTAIKNLKKDEFSFVIMDEIFTGTNPKEGMAGAYGVAKKLSTYENNMSIIATHFKVLTELAEDTNGAFENNKVRVNKLDGGKIEFLYKLEKGVTDQDIALELLQQAGFDSDILQDAFNVLHNKHQVTAAA